LPPWLFWSVMLILFGIGFIPAKKPPSQDAEEETD